MTTVVLHPIPAAGARVKGALEARVSLIFLVAFCVDLITPVLIWKRLIPEEVRWVSHAAVAVMAFGCLARVLVFKRLPPAAGWLVALSAVWGFVAVGQGQGLGVTAWGWLLFAQFPLVALFIYLTPDDAPPPVSFLLKAGLVLLALEVAVQLVQFVLGEAPGDDLTGTLGRKGSQQVAVFSLLINALFLGYWLVTGRKTGLMISLLLGVVSNVLAENKLYPVGLVGIGILAVCILAYRRHSLGTLVKYAVLVLLALGAFFYLYGVLVPGSETHPLLGYVTDPSRLAAYLNLAVRVDTGGDYRINMGRNYALNVGWTSLQKDPVTLLFGYGLGARSESQTLGLAGQGFAAGQEGVWVGTSLLVMMQEMGLVGLALLGATWIAGCVGLARAIRRDPGTPATGLRYAALFFTAFWPLWLWYSTVWTMRAPMLLYWLLIGYAFRGAAGRANPVLEEG